MHMRNSFRFASAVVGLGALTASGHAATRTWDGDSSTDWNTAANWTSNTLPGAGDTAVIVKPGNGRLPELSANVTIGAMTMRQNAKVDTNGFTLELTAANALN